MRLWRKHLGRKHLFPVLHSTCYMVLLKCLSRSWSRLGMWINIQKEKRKSCESRKCFYSGLPFFFLGIIHFCNIYSLLPAIKPKKHAFAYKTLNSVEKLIFSPTMAKYIPKSKSLSWILLILQLGQLIETAPAIVSKSMFLFQANSFYSNEQKCSSFLLFPLQGGLLLLFPTIKKLIFLKLTL